MTKNIPKIIRLFHFTTDGVADIDDPALSEVIAAVKDLNGNNLDTVSVTLSNGDSMDVGGGERDQYKCHARTNDNFYDLIDPKISRDSQDLVMIIMNQEINAFQKYCLF